jgi:hypothetical protein
VASQVSRKSSREPPSEEALVLRCAQHFCLHRSSICSHLSLWHPGQWIVNSRMTCPPAWLPNGLVTPTGNTCCLTLQNPCVTCHSMIIFSWWVQLTMRLLTDPNQGKHLGFHYQVVRVWESHFFCLTMTCTACASLNVMAVVEKIDSYRG